MSNITKKTYNAKIGLSNQERENFNTNAVAEANRVASEYIAETTEQLEAALAGVEQYGDRLATAETEVAKKANVNGFYDTLGAGDAKRLISDTGVDILQTVSLAQTGDDDETGQANIGDGSAQFVARGNTWIKNQLIDFNNSYFGDKEVYGVNITANKSTGTITLNGTATENHYAVINYPVTTIGNVHLIYTDNISIYPNINGTTITQGDNYKIITATTAQTYATAYIEKGRTYNNETFKLRLVDLTKMGLDHIETVAEFNNLTRNLDTDTYDAGSFVSYEGGVLDSVGFNAFDGELELGRYSTTGVKIDAPDFIRATNKIPVVCGGEYTLSYLNNTIPQTFYIYEYDKNNNIINTSLNAYISTVVHTRNITLTDKTCYVTFQIYASGITIPTDAQICFHLTGDGSLDGTYKPYSKSIIDLTSVGTLRSAGTAYDYATEKEKNIVIGTYTFTGNETISIGGVTTKGLYRYYVAKTDMKIASGGNGLCDRLPTDKGDYNATEIPAIRFGQKNSAIYIYLAENFATSAEVAGYLAGMTIYYELETPTTETLSLNLIVPVEKLGTLGTESEVPPVLALTYAKDIAGFAESLGNRQDIMFNPNNIASKADLGVVWTKDLTSTQMSGFMQSQVAGGAFYVVVSATPNITGNLNDVEIDISDAPEGTATSIYDANGVTANEEVSSETLISLGVGRTQSSTMLFSLIHSGANKLKIRFDTSVSANQLIDCRTYLTIKLTVKEGN